MPYIKQEDKESIFNTPRSPSNAGELNFVVTAICLKYFEEQGGRYQQINDIVGALEGAKLEFYRRLVSKYEDKKAIENGDVY